MSPARKSSIFFTPKFKPMAWAICGAATATYFATPASLPPGHYQDSAALALNAACLLHAGTDEFGRKFPLFFESFGDFKAPALIYLTAGWFKAFGASLTSLRLLTMLYGWLCAVGILAFARSSGLFPRPKAPLFFPIAYATLLLSSWFYSFFRFPGEATLVPPLVLMQFALLWAALTARRAPIAALSALGLGLVAGIGPFAYHNLKIVNLLHFGILPLALLMARARGERLRPHRSALLLLSLLLTAAVLTPYIWDYLGERKTFARLGQVSDFQNHTLAEAAWDFGKRYLAHVNGIFFFLKGDHNKRHHHGFLGHFALILAPFLFWGLIALGRDLYARRKGAPAEARARPRALSAEEHVFWTYAVLFLAASFVPPSLTSEGIPHAGRSSAALVPLCFVMAYGLWVAHARDWFSNAHFKKALAVSSIALALSIAWYSALYPARSASYWVLNEELERQAAGPALPDVGNHSPATVFARFFAVERDRSALYCGPPA